MSKYFFFTTGLKYVMIVDKPLNIISAEFEAILC